MFLVQPGFVHENHLRKPSSEHLVELEGAEIDLFIDANLSRVESQSLVVPS